MKIVYLEMGLFDIALVFLMLVQIYGERKKYRDCLLFSRLLIFTIAILSIDTLGWFIDGNPVFGQIWFTTLVDGLDLILTISVCWCWVQYARYIVYEDTKVGNLKRRLDFSSILLALQIILVLLSQVVDFYYYIDATGVYHRSRGYFIHNLLCLTMLGYSSIICIASRKKAESPEKKRDLLFVAFVILIPIAGDIFQAFVYGYPTVWLCFVFMILAVYIHIENKRIENEREQQNKVLESALTQAESASEAKTIFLSNMSHDIRTPLNAILGLTSLSLDEPDIPPQIKENLENIHSSGDFLLRLINDILDMEKIEAGKIQLNMEPYSYKEFMASMQTMFKPLCEQKNICFQFEKVAESRTVMADKLRINQIFFNILSNAIKYTPEGGTVSYYTENFRIKDDIVSCDYLVQDTGIGMSKEFLEKVFNPFEQEDKGYRSQLNGSGLGLSIAKSLVEMMGGTISIQSVVNQGTTVRIHLCFRVEDDITTDIKGLENGQELDETMFKGKHILLVEDHPLNANIAQKILEKKGMIVHHAENGKVAVDEFEASETDYYDAIVMDVRMPVMDGIEATKMIRKLERVDAKKVPIIAMTANAYEEDIRKTKEAGMNLHLSKPIEPSEVYKALLQCFLKES